METPATDRPGRDERAGEPGAPVGKATRDERAGEPGAAVSKATRDERAGDWRWPIDEARLEGGIPVTAGWFVVNARDARWMHNQMRSVCRFGGQGPAHFDDLGVGLYWLEPGHPMSLYHHEAGQEDFLVLRGSAKLVVEGAERELRAWDFVHCPPRTAHTIVAAEHEPALILAVGARKEKGSARYPVEPAAVRHGAGVPDESLSADDVYGRFGDPRPGPAPEIFG